MLAFATIFFAVSVMYVRVSSSKALDENSRLRPAFLRESAILQAIRRFILAQWLIRRGNNSRMNFGERQSLTIVCTFGTWSPSYGTDDEESLRLKDGIRFT